MFYEEDIPIALWFERWFAKLDVVASNIAHICFYGMCFLGELLLGHMGQVIPVPG